MKTLIGVLASLLFFSSSVQADQHRDRQVVTGAAAGALIGSQLTDDPLTGAIVGGFIGAAAMHHAHSPRHDHQYYSQRHQRYYSSQRHHRYHSSHPPHRRRTDPHSSWHDRRYSPQTGCAWETRYVFDSYYRVHRHQQVWVCRTVYPQRRGW